MYKAEKSGQMTFEDAIRRLYAQQKEMFDLRRTGH